MMTDTVRVINTIIKKELVDSLRSLKLILPSGVICFNFCIYATEAQIFALFSDELLLRRQLGSNLMYLSAMAILFLGAILVTRLIYEEKKNKTIHMMLSMGLPPVTLWLAKILTIAILCELYSLINIGVHLVFLKIAYGYCVLFTGLSAVMTFVMIPVLCIGLQFLLSLAFMFFSKMNLIGTFLQIVPYMAIWNLSAKLIQYTVIPGLALILSLGIGVLMILIACFLVRNIPKDRLVTRID